MFPGHLTNNLAVAEKCELRQVERSSPGTYCNTLGQSMVDAMGECLMESVGDSMVDSVGESLDLVKVVVVDESLE